MRAAAEMLGFSKHRFLSCLGQSWTGLGVFFIKKMQPILRPTSFRRVPLPGIERQKTRAGHDLRE